MGYRLEKSGHKFHSIFNKHFHILCWPSFAGGRPVRGRLHLCALRLRLCAFRLRLCAFCLRLCAFVSVRGHALLSVGIPLRSWALVFVCVWPAFFVRVRFGIVVRRWEVGKSSWPFVV